MASAVGAAAGVWGFEEPQAPRASVVAATRAEAVRVRRVMIMNLTVRENTRGAHCSGNHVKPRNLKDLRGESEGDSGGNQGTPGVFVCIRIGGLVARSWGRGLVLWCARVQAVA